MSIWVVCASCLLCALIGKVLEKHNREYSLALSVFCGCSIAAVAVAGVLPIKDRLDTLLAGNATLTSYLKLLMKSLGICYLAGFASSSCKDAGENGLSRAVETFARVTVAALYLPVLLDLLNAVTGWLGGSQ